MRTELKHRYEHPAASTRLWKANVLLVHLYSYQRVVNRLMQETASHLALTTPCLASQAAGQITVRCVGAP